MDGALDVLKEPLAQVQLLLAGISPVGQIVPSPFWAAIDGFEKLTRQTPAAQAAMETRIRIIVSPTES
ncbi:MAG: hypothetical protein ACXW3D_05705 [Caulobacteraceae bacterium]